MNLLKLLSDYFENKPKPFLITLNVVILLSIGLIDYLTGYEIELTLFYLIPISFAAWLGGKRQGVLISCLSVLTIGTTDFLAGQAYAHLFAESWNLLMRLGFFVVYSVVLSLVKTDLDERKRLLEELQKALGEIKVLSGLLPICSSCKKIRDDNGYWNQIETYISMHSEAQFTHSICPDCVKKLYPEHCERILEKKKDTRL